MNRIIIALAIFCSLSASVCHGQQPPAAAVVYVESWRTGNKIREQALNFDLNSSNIEHTAIVRDVGLGYYKLILRHISAGEKDYQLEHWAVQLRPILSERNKREKLGANLLTREGPEPGGDNFPREDYVGYLYPREAPKDALERLLDGRFYSASAKRVIKVENFYLIIQVNNFKMNDTNPKKLDSMNVTVELRNAYSRGADCN